MALLRYTAKLDPFFSLDFARLEGRGAQSKERKGSNFAIWQPCRHSDFVVVFRGLEACGPFALPSAVVRGVGGGRGLEGHDSGRDGNPIGLEAGQRLGGCYSVQGK